MLTAVVSSTTFLPAQKSGIPVSATDIINGLVPAPVDTNYVRSFEGGPIDNLTDGKTASDPTNLNEFSAQQNAVFSLDGGIPAPQQHGAFWYAIYRLPLASAPAGYDISEVDSITGHQDNRTDQTIDIEVQFVGDDNFYSLSNNNNFSFRPGRGDGAGKLVVTDDTGGPLARGVRAIKFEADQQAVYRELDVLGTATPPPTSGPAAPTNLTATVAGSDVRLSFTDQANNEAGFRIERAPVVGGVTGTFALLANLGANNTPPPAGVGGQITYTDNRTEVGQSYQYRVTAFNAFGGGATSTPLTANATTPTTGAGAAARYFASPRWGGTPVGTQIDPDLSDNNFGAGSPLPAVPVDQFSAIYSGRITPTETGTYTFPITADDEGFFFIGGGDIPTQTLVTDNNGASGITLTAGQSYDFVYVAREITGAANFSAQWTTPSSDTPAAIPASVMTSTMTPVTQAPTGLASANLTTNSVDVTFTDNSNNEVKFQLERAAVTGGVAGAYAVVAEDMPNVGTLTDTTANPNTTYSYRVRAFNFEGSAVSAPIQVTTPARVRTNGATGAWYDSGFWGQPTRPPQGGLVVTASPDLREEETAVTFPNGTLDRPGIGTPSGTPNNNDNFSTVFTGKIIAPETGEYRILGFGDDDTHVFVNGVLTSSDPNGHGPPTNDAAGIASIDVRTPITLTAGQSYNFVVMQAEQGGGSAVMLRWITPSAFASSGETFAEDVPTEDLTNISDLPGAPTAGAANTATATTATINFNDNSVSELRYKVEMSRTADFSTIDRTFSAPINATSATATGLTPGTTYYFRIRGTNLEGEGPALTTQVTTSSTPVPPNAPSNLVVRTTNDRNFSLNFTDNSNNEDNFIIQRRLNNTGDFTTVATLGPNVTSFQDQVFPAPPRNTPVTYRVSSRNAEGTSAPVELTVLSGFPGGTGLSATAYATSDFTDNPDNPNDPKTYLDPEVGENWSLGPPIAGIPEDNFSVVWSGQVQAEKTEPYTFQIEGDDADSQMELIITDTSGNELVNIPLATSGAARSSAPVNLVAGQRYNLSMRYSEGTGGAAAYLRWSSPSTPLEVIPQVFLFPGPSTAASIDAVYVRGATWAGPDTNPANTTFGEFLAAKGLGDATYGYRVDNLPADTTIPWINVNQVVLHYSGPLSAGGLPTPGSVVLDGQLSDYTVTAVTQLDPQTVALTLDRALGIQPPPATDPTQGDRIKLKVPTAGPGGTDYTTNLNVLQGDADRAATHRVNAIDLGFVKARANTTSNDTATTGAVYTAFADLNGSGRIDAIDLGAAKARNNDALPPAAAVAGLFSSKRIADEVLG